jgi:hypothetical protein
MLDIVKTGKRGKVRSFSPLEGYFWWKSKRGVFGSACPSQKIHPDLRHQAATYLVYQSICIWLEADWSCSAHPRSTGLKRRFSVNPLLPRRKTYQLLSSEPVQTRRRVRRVDRSLEIWSWALRGWIFYKLSWFSNNTFLTFLSSS